MRKAQILLKLFLDELGISSEIDTIEDRKRVQKAVYIGQAAGINLGYPYGWYLMGPYSPELTKDYFSLNNEVLAGNEEYKQYKLIPEFSCNINKIKGLMEVPPGIALNLEDWLELVASIIYRMKVQGSSDHVKSFLLTEKPHLVKYFDDAFSLSKKYGLIPG